jgi:putative spermidine/putrescine transport system permease protein
VAVPRPRRRSRGLRVATLVLPAVLVIAMFFAMMSTMLVSSLSPGEVVQGMRAYTLEHYRRFLGSSFYWGYLTGSLWISLYCTFITAVLGYFIAYFMFRASSAVRLVVGSVLIVQFFTAYVIRSYAVMLLVGKTGFLNQALLALGIVDAPLRILFTQTAVAIGLVQVSLPFMVFPILASLNAIPANLEMASASLGASGFKTFWTIIFPLTFPGIAAGVVVVYLFELTSYIVPGMLGGGYADMIANLIYNKAMRSFEYGFAAAAAVVTLVVSAAIVYGLNRSFARMTRYA